MVFDSASGHDALSVHIILRILDLILIVPMVAHVVLNHDKCVASIILRNFVVFV